MIRPFSLCLCLAFSLGLIKPGLAQSHAEIDAYLQQVRQSHALPGMAVAIVRDGRLLHRGVYGQARLEPSQAVSSQTVFPLFSSTKIFSVVATSQAIEAGKFSLTTPLGQLLDDLPPTWRDIEIRHLLSHSSGLPDIVNFEQLQEEQAKLAIYNVALKFPAGQEFDYNQTNFWLLNRVFQRVYGVSLPHFIVSKQFASQPGTVFFETSPNSSHQNYSPGYNNTGGNLLQRNWHFPAYNFGAAGLNLSLDDFLRWNQQFDQGAFLSKSGLQQLYRPFNYQKSHSFVHGWEKIELQGVPSYGFSGGMATAFRKVPDKKLTVILLNNALLIPGPGKPSLNQVVNELILRAEKIPLSD